MKTFDAMTRVLVLVPGRAQRWLRQELALQGVNIPLTGVCVAELARAADRAVCHAGADERPYVVRLRAMLLLQADFLQRWTGSDAGMQSADDPTLQELVKIARQHALPRRWKLTESVVREYQRRRPSYFRWTDDLDPATVSR